MTSDIKLALTCARCRKKVSNVFVLGQGVPLCYLCHREYRTEFERIIQHAFDAWMAMGKKKKGRKK